MFVFRPHPYTDSKEEDKKKRNVALMIVQMWNGTLKNLAAVTSPFLYLENDWRAWLLLQDPSSAEGFKVRVWIVEQVGVVVDQ